MTFLATAVVAATTLYTADRQRAAQKKGKKLAEEKANRDEISARKAEAFAETEGEGIGSLGTMSLEVDEDVDDNVRASNLGKSTVRI
jgi:hypothetical protein